METRHFELSDGKSNKFWILSLDGSVHTVKFGRIGTAGQQQVKEFGSADEARKSYDQLVSEKLKKGYIELLAGGEANAAQSGALPQPSTSQRSAPVPTPPAELQRSLGLRAEDWLWATWRPRLILPRVERPFDRDAASARVREFQDARGRWKTGWNLPRLPPCICHEEACFWLDALHGPEDLVNAVSDRLMGGSPDRQILATVLTKSRQRYWCGESELTANLLANIVPLPILIGVLLDRSQHPTASGAEFLSLRHGAPSPFAAGLRERIWSFISPEDWSCLQDIVRDYMQAGHWSLDLLSMAGWLGLGTELLPIVESWPDEAFEDWRHAETAGDVVMGLGDPGLVERHARRSKLPLTPSHARAWLAHTEFGATDYLQECAIRSPDGEKIVQVLGLARSPETARLMLKLHVAPHASEAAGKWLEANPLYAAVGLAPAAVPGAPMWDDALSFLRGMKRRGQEDALQAAIGLVPEYAAVLKDALEEEVETRLPVFDDESTPAWLRETGNLKPASTLWLGKDGPVPPSVGDRCLNPAQLRLVYGALRNSTPDAAHPLIGALKAHADPASLDAFAWKLFEMWLGSGAASKEKWAMLGVGLLGSDALALKLTPLIRAWPGESQHARAVFGLDCLRACGTDTALMQINGIAQKVSFKGLKTKAAECMEAIAASRGFTRHELEDRIVPDCGLDDRGTRWFDFGPRKFRMVLGPGMKPFIRDKSGQLKPDLPKPTRKDDPDAAEQAVADWKLVKKQVADVARVQAVRLAQAMVTGRHWTTEEFEMLLVRHPLMTNLSRLLVWTVLDEFGRKAATFRVTEDLTYADEHDNTFDLRPFPSVAIVHPLRLSTEEAQTWGDVFSDYEIVPPFPQLGRTVYALEPGEESLPSIKRFVGRKVPGISLVGTLERLGWDRAIPEDGGRFYEHSRPFYGANVTSVVQYEDGVYVGMIQEEADQEITECFFVPGIYVPRDYYPEHKERIPLAEVDPVVISEVLSDLTGIVAKAR